MSVSRYINEFESLLNKTTKFGTTMSEDILAYRLLKSANLSEEQEQLVKATIDRYTFDTMQEQLKRICGDKKMSNEASFKSDIKVESDIFYQKDSQGDDIDDQNETYCEGGQNQYGYKKCQNPLNSSYRGEGYYQRSTSDRSSRNTFQSNSRRENPLDYRVNVSRCKVCQSTFRRAKDCPNKNATEVTLYQSILHTEEALQQFTGEAFCAAILDSGASKTVCGKTWLRCYEETLPKEKQELIHSEPSTGSFKFGDGRKVQSIMKVTILAKINNTDRSIVTDLINDNAPLLLFKEAIKKANSKIDFSSDSVFMFGSKVPVIVTTSGHYTIPIGELAALEEHNEKKQKLFYKQKQ